MEISGFPYSLVPTLLSTENMSSKKDFWKFRVFHIFGSHASYSWKHVPQERFLKIYGFPYSLVPTLLSAKNMYSIKDFWILGFPYSLVPMLLLAWNMYSKKDFRKFRVFHIFWFLRLFTVENLQVIWQHLGVHFSKQTLMK